MDTNQIIIKKYELKSELVFFLFGTDDRTCSERNERNSDCYQRSIASAAQCRLQTKFADNVGIVASPNRNKKTMPHNGIVKIGTDDRT